MSLRSLNFRLATLFSVLFVIFSIVLFGFSYVLLQSTLKGDQDAEIKAKMLEFWVLYEVSGVDLLSEESFSEEYQEEWSLYLVRLADRQNQTIFVYVPGYWNEFDSSVLEAIDPAEKKETIRLESPESSVIVDVLFLHLHDGNILQIGVDVTGRVETMKRFRRIFLVITVPLLIFGFLGGLLFSRRSLRPIHNLIRVIRSIIDTGRLDDRIPLRGVGDELDELVGLFNNMIGKIDLLIRGMRDSLDNVAHDLRTPMTRLIGHAQSALETSKEASSTRENLTAIVEESEVMLKMLKALMDISEAEAGAMRLNREVIDLSPLILDIAEFYRYAAAEKSIEFRTSVPDGLFVSVDPNRLRQVIANLLDNAIKYTLQSGLIELEAGIKAARVFVVVRDSGIGISERDIKSIWDRLYRGDQSRSEPGLGLGLSLVKAIVGAHEGSVHVSSELGNGSEFTFTLPNITDL